MLRLVAGLLLALAPGAYAREIVIFDTDSGLFGDDGAALVMLLRSPAQAAIHGITVTPGNVWAAQGAEYVFHILELLKRPQVPVFTGAERPLVNSAAMAREAEKRWGALTYTGALTQDPAAVKPAPGASHTNRRSRRESAVAFLIAEIEGHPGELTI